MGGDRGFGVIVEVAAVVLLGAMVAGQALGQPVLLSYVTTGSMEPTLEPGDGFVAIPAAAAGPVETGDVVVFRAEQLHGGGLTTHRVVEETDRGYVTRGDANPFTDQDGDEPPVKSEQVVAVAWQPGGDVLVLPGLGSVITGTRSILDTGQRHVAGLLGTRAVLGPQGLAYLLSGTTVGYYLVSAWRADGGERERSRARETPTDPRLYAAAFTALVVVAATAAMVVPAGPQQFGVVSAESDSPGQRVIEQGTSESVDYPVGNGGFLPVVAYFDSRSDRATVEPTSVAVPARESRHVSVTLSAPPETGYYRHYVVEYRYLAVLPRPLLDVLHGVHPWLPILVVDALLAGPFYLLNRRLLGTGRVRSRSRGRDTPGDTRLGLER